MEITDIKYWIDRVISNNKNDVKDNTKLRKLLEGLQTEEEDIGTKLDGVRYPEDSGLDQFEDVDKFEKIILYKEVFDKTEKLREEFKNAVKGILKEIEDES